MSQVIEPGHEKIICGVSDQVGHKPGYTTTAKSLKFRIKKVYDRLRTCFRIYAHCMSHFSTLVFDACAESRLSHFAARMSQSKLGAACRYSD